MNWKQILTLLMMIGGIGQIILTAVIPVLDGVTPDLLGLAIGITLLLFGVVGYLKRDRWDYWLTMLQGKPHVETLISHDPKNYDEINKEPNQRRGRAMERTALGLVYIVALAGYVIMPFVGPATMAVIAGAAIAGAAALYAVKFLLAHYEFKAHATKRQVIIEWVDEENNEGEVFLEDVKISRRSYVDKKSMMRVLDGVEKELKASQKELTITGEHAIDQLSPEIAAQIKEYREATDDQFEEKIIERLRASEAVKKFYAVGIDKTVDFDYADDEAVRQAIIDEDAGKTLNVTPTVTLLTEPPKEKPKQRFYCTKCGFVLVPSQSPNFFFKCTECDKNTNEATFEKMVIYEPHIYSFYPSGDLKRRCILVFPVKVNIALDPDSEITVRFHYTKFKAKANWIRAIKLGTVTETLFHGDFIDGIQIELPKEIRAIDSQVPIFVATDFDYAEKRRLEGLQMVRPPVLLKWFIRLTKAVITASNVGHKLEDKEIEIGKLATSRQRLIAMINAIRTEAALEAEDPAILPPVQTAEIPKPPPKAKPLAKLQALAVALVFLGIGVLITPTVLIPALGYRIIPIP